MCACAGDSENTIRSLSASGPPIETRRSFLGALLGVGSVCVGALLSVPLIRFALFPLLRRTTELKSSPLGALEQVDGWRKAISERAVYVTKDTKGNLRVLTSVCPHLGCTVPWNKEKNQFICPCHGAAFTSDGARITGPSLRGMDALETSVENDQLLAQFQYFRQLVSDKEVIG